jgi:hypothetical protein
MEVSGLTVARKFSDLGQKRKAAEVYVVPWTGIEPVTFRLGGGRSIP